MYGWLMEVVVKDRSVSHFGDGETEVLFFQGEGDVALMAGKMWRTLGVRPFEDVEFDGVDRGDGVEDVKVGEV